MRRLLLITCLLLAGCVVEEGPCEDGSGRCFGNRMIEYCLDGEWQEPEDCPPFEVGGGQFIETVCYEEQARCAP